MGMNFLLHQAITLDIETLGVTKGSAIWQVALFDAAKQEALLMPIAPTKNMVVVDPSSPADRLAFTTSTRERVRMHPGLEKLNQVTYQDVVNAHILMNKQAEENLRQAWKTKKIAGHFAPDDLEQMRKFDKATVLKAIKQTHPFLHGALTKQEGELMNKTVLDYMSGATPQRTEDLENLLFARSGRKIRVVQATETAIEAVIGASGVIERKAKGKALWIANAAFESKQLGARIAIREQAFFEQYRAGLLSESQLHDKLRETTGLRNYILGSSGTSSDPTYVTGKEVNKARLSALMGEKGFHDWRKVFRAYVDHTKAGDVRDILDVVRAQQSYGQTMGLLSGNKPFALSMEVQARLYGYSVAETKKEALAALSQKELHHALVDASVTEELVRVNALRQAFALEQVQSGTDLGQAFVEMAEKKQGPLYQALKQLQVTEKMAPEFKEIALKQRYANMLMDFAASDMENRGPLSRQAAGTAGVRVRQIMPTGAADLEIGIPRHLHYESVEDAARFISSRGEYAGVDTKKVYRSLIDDVVRLGHVEDVGGKVRIKNAEKLFTSMEGLAQEGSRKQAKALMNAAMKAPDAFTQAMPMDIRSLLGTSKKFHAKLDRNLKIKTAGIFGFGLAAAGLAVAGAFKALKDGPRRQREGPESLRTMNYERWLDQQARFSGLDDSHMSQPTPKSVFTMSGMRPGGIARVFRSQNTDFGSPYQGPVTSESVFQEISLLHERQRYLRAVYGAVHYDPSANLGKLMHEWLYSPGGDPINPIHAAKNMLMHTRASGLNHNFIQGNLEVINGAQYAGLRAKNLLRLDLGSGGWKVDAEDADTIVVKRAGTLNAIADMFGMNPSYSFRLAGIDAPETEHAGGSGYHREQPYAYAGAEAARAMIHNAKNIELLIDPANITYGRQVATVFTDGTNLNLEMVRRGMAAHLPFKKKGTQAMYSLNAYEAAETLAQKGSVGMWSTPFFKAYKDITAASGQTITFNTLTQINKIAKNATMMSASSLMRQAEQQGFYSTANAIEASEIGKRFKQTGYKADFSGRGWNTTFGMKTNNAPHKAYMQQQLQEVSSLVRTKGGKYDQKLKAKNMTQMDKSLTLDTLGTSTSIWSKRRYTSYDDYGVDGRKEKRRRSMEMAQKYANWTFFNSPINHHAM